MTSIVSCHGDSRENIIPSPESFPLYTTAEVVDEIMFENASGLTIAVQVATIAIIPRPCARSPYLRRTRQSNPQLTIAASKAARAWLENVKYIATAKKNTRRRWANASCFNSVPHRRIGAATTPITAPSELGFPIISLPDR